MDLVDLMSPDQSGGPELVFVKLGGSVITDKTKPETARMDVILRLAAEVSQALTLRPDLSLVVGHGSGSFGHMTAARFGTRQGVREPAAWRGFVQVAAVASRLNRLVADTLLEAGVPAWSLQPSATARCVSGELVSLGIEPLKQALARHLVPLVYGDVALDDEQGGTIISTEQILAYLARHLRPSRLLLVGTVDGVYEGDPLQDPTVRHLPEITPSNWREVRALLGASHAPDVTGGMLAKVETMVSLVQELPGLTIQILSGEHPGALERALLQHGTPSSGTTISWTGS